MKSRYLITVDGPCASGKTTFAHQLASLLRATVIHTDDFVIPHEQKTVERLAIPGGNCDAERLAAEVLSPWKNGLPVRFRRYDCKKGKMLPAEELPETQLLILEGSYCNLPMLRQYADFRLYLDTPKDLRMKRLRERESDASLRLFMEKWIPLEEAYFKAYGLPDEGILCIPGQG